MRFTLTNGRQFELTAMDVQDRLHDVSPEPVQEYGVQIGLRYPVKQTFEAATGVPPANVHYSGGAATTRCAGFRDRDHRSAAHCGSSGRERQNNWRSPRSW